MLKKSIMAVMLAAIMLVSSSSVAFAAESESFDGKGWWDAGRVNTKGVSIADGDTVTFDIDMDAPVSADDTYAAVCVEVSDGTYFYTTTSDGDCWGYLDGTTEIGKVIKDMNKASMARGGSYEVAVTRDGSNFTVTYTDVSTGEPLFGTLYFTANDGFVFGDSTAYVIPQVGSGKVTVKAADAAADAAATDDTAAATTDVPKTGVVGFGVVYGLAALATGTVAFKRKQK